ncbi:MAG: hypothetical protein HYX68_04605 [Planctomycetes bacterium]|nr:hypothetical protein [Planctomycetota bacterium]
MNRMIVKSRIGSDGNLHLNVPIGPDDAGRVVRIIIEPENGKTKTQQEYLDFINATAGAWQGDFERPEQGEFEERDPLP